MKIVLLEDILTLGRKGDVKEVSRGYARNFLLPKNLVKPATRQALKWLETQKEIIQKAVEEDLKKAQDLASQVDGLELNIAVKVGDGGQLFESINNQKIVEKLKEMGFEIKKSQINLENSIKELGEFPVKINLEHNLEAEIKVIVTPSPESEAEKASEDEEIAV